MKGSHPGWIEDVLEDLRQRGWNRRVAARGRGGGQADVVQLEHRDGRRGAFRAVRSADDKALARFHRELGVLRDPDFAHPAIVDLYEHTENRGRPWYVSRWGEPFAPWWAAIRATNGAESTAIEAVRIVNHLASGLVAPHSAGIVHRDIKPSNIILLSTMTEADVPALIDFGIAFAPDEDRLTDTSEGVGNVRFSPDVAARRLEEPPPWLDVFNLGQLLVWMTQTPAATHWNRPLDWRYVQFAPELPEGLHRALRAIAAVASEQSDHMDAAALVELLGRLVPSAPSAENRPLDISAIRVGLGHGEAERELRRADWRSRVETWGAAVAPLYLALRSGIQPVIDELGGAGLGEVESEETFDDYVTYLRRDNTGEVTLIGLRMGTSPHIFHVRVQAAVSHAVTHNEAYPPDAAGIALYIQRYSEARDFPHVTQLVTVHSDGRALLRTENLNEIREVDAQQLIEIFRALVNDPDPWNVVSR